MEILCTITSLELFSLRNQDARLWVARIMAKLIMCREEENKDMVVVSSAISLTGMARRMHLMAALSLVARRTFSVIFVTSMVT